MLDKNSDEFQEERKREGEVKQLINDMINQIAGVEE